jgi:MFS family permease
VIVVRAGISFDTAVFIRKRLGLKIDPVSIWSNRNYVRVWSGQVVSVMGDGIHKIAILLWAKQETGSNAAVAAVALANAIPSLAAPIGGGLADRFDRRRLMIAADAARIGSSVAIAALLLGGGLTVPLLCALTACASFAAAVFDPTYSASVTMLVREEDRVHANAMNLANSAAGGLIGPAVGGVLIASTSFGTALIIDALTFAVSAALILASHIPSPRRAHAVGEGLRIREGAATVWKDRNVRALTGLGMTLNLATAPLGVLLVALTVDHLGGGARTLGALQAVLAIGLLGGSLVVGMLARRRHALLVAFLAVGACVVTIGLGDGVVIAGAALLGVGAGVAIANTTLVTRFQLLVPPEQQGRAFGVIGGASQLLRPVGLALTAPLVAAFGVRGSYVACGAVLVLATLAWAPAAGLMRGPRRGSPDLSGSGSSTTPDVEGDLRPHAAMRSE